MSYDFLGSAYIKTTISELNLSLSSIRDQTLKPNKVVLVVDGPLNFNLENLLKDFKRNLNFEVLYLKKNFGLGISLRKGMELCTSEFVLRFDTDDYNLPTRAEKQINFMKKGNLDISSTTIYEFIDSPNNKISLKNVPLSQKDIIKIIPFRNPFNHPSVGFKLDSIRILSGGYRNFPLYEDYDLWIRALNSGFKASNISEPLVGMKFNELIERRVGLKIVLNEARLFLTFFNYSKSQFMLFIPAFFSRTFIRLLPSFIVKKFYSLFLREKSF